MPLQDFDEHDSLERLNRRIENVLAPEERAAAAFATMPGLELMPPGGEVRAATNGSKRILEGYAVVWGAFADLGDFVERLVRGCFGRSLTSGQIGCFLSHNSGAVLCSQRSNSLDLEEDSTGLRFRAELNNTSAANDCWENVQRGEINAMSFGFICKRDKWGEVEVDPDDDDETETYSRRRQCRTVVDANLLEVSPTYFAAYKATSVTAAERALSIWPNGVPAEIRSRFSGCAVSAADQDLIMQVRLQALKLEGF